MATTLLSKTKSTTGSPYAYYTVTGEETARTTTSVTIKVTVTWNLQYSESWIGTGFSLDGYIYLGGSWRKITLKPSATSVSGTKTRTASASFSVSASAATTSLTGIYFKVESSSSAYPGTELTSTACNNMPISRAAAASTGITISNCNVGSATTIKLTKNTSGVQDKLYYRYYKDGAWSSWTYITAITGSSYSWTVPTAIADVMWSTYTTITCQIGVDSYYSGTYLGTNYSSNFTVTLPSSVGKPTGLTLGSSAVQGKTATFNIGTPTLKHNATLSGYTITPSKGTASRSGNKVTITFSENVNTDVSVSVYATDSRGFTSNTATITLSPIDLTTKTLSLSATAYTYDGTAKKPTPTISGLTSGTGYSISYKNNTNAGTATATATGIGLVNGTISKTFTINRRTITEREMTVAPLYYTYDGTAKTPSVSIEGLVLNTDYTLLYHNNIDAGVAIVEAVGRGNYKDVISKNFYILNKSLFNIILKIVRNQVNQVMPIEKGGTGATTSAEAVGNLKSDLVDIVYPIGAIYMSVNSTNPSTLFGGTWVQLKDQFLLGAGSSYTAGNTGGAATVTLTTSTIPGHTHSFTGTSSQSTGTGSYDSDYSGRHNVKGGAGSATGSIAAPDSMASTYSSWRTLSGHALTAGSHTHTVTASGSIANKGGGGAHNNMPPYLAVYMWKRTA